MFPIINYLRKKTNNQAELLDEISTRTNICLKAIKYFMISFAFKNLTQFASAGACYLSDVRMRIRTFYSDKFSVCGPMIYKYYVVTP